MELWFRQRGNGLRLVLGSLFGLSCFFFGSVSVASGDMTVNGATDPVVVTSTEVQITVERSGSGRFSMFAPDGLWCNWDPNSPVVSSLREMWEAQSVPDCDQGDGVYHVTWVDTSPSDCGNGFTHDHCVASGAYLGTDVEVIVFSGGGGGGSTSTTSTTFAPTEAMMDALQTAALGVAVLVFAVFLGLGFKSIYDS